MNKQTHESGQATTEYALVLLAAAVIALLVIAWATNGEGASRIGDGLRLVARLFGAL